MISSSVLRDRLVVLQEGKESSIETPDDRFPHITHRMRIDVETARLIGELEQAGIPCLLLKGASVAKWLYETHEARFYFDIDLLISPDDAPTTEGVLLGLGFSTPRVDLRGDRWIVRDWHREDGLSVDIHRSLEGLGCSDQEAWQVLSDSAIGMEVAGRVVPVLGPHARALHVALHALQHGRAHPQPMEDLRRAVDSLPLEVWEGALGLAREMGSEAHLGAGLALTPMGVLLGSTLGVPRPIDTQIILKQDSASKASLFIERVVKAGYLGGSKLVLRKAFPSPTFMRSFDASAGEGRWQLALSYPRRWIWLASQLGSGLREWAEVRGPRRH